MISISILILLVAKALPFISSHVSNIYFTRISTMVFIYAGVLSFNTFYIQSIGSGIGIYSGLFHITNISVLIEFFLLLIGSIILIAWPLYNKTSFSIINNNKEIIESEAPLTKGLIQQKLYNRTVDNLNYSTDYSLIVLFSTLGSCLLISSSDLISMYLSIELQSFGLYVLSTLYKDSESSTKAGLKYFLLGGLSSCLILLGAGLIYAYTGLTNFESIYSLISVIGSGPILQGFYLGLILIIIGFLFKISAAPLHNWSPDVYDETPTIVTIWLTVMPKISILIFLLEFITPQLSYSIVGPETLLILSTNNVLILKNLLLVSSLLSLIIGTVVGLAQTRIKRLLAYSTISHIGFILLALLINTEQSIDSLIFYIIQYSITNLNIFLILIALSYIMNRSSDIKYISELKEQFILNPLLSLSLSICLFSMAGIPPLIGFFSKQFVLYSAIQSGYYFISIIAIIVSVISASYYLKIIKVMTEQKNESPSILSGSLITESPLTNFHSFLISTLTLTILLFIFKPSLILNSTQLLSLSLFNF
jgi:NADH-ubiquinone oxidoreductase chain 2